MEGDDDVEVVRRNSAAFSARDVDAMLRCYAADAEVIDQRRLGFGHFTGHAELRGYYEGITHSAADMHEELEVLASAGGVVVAHCELSGHLASDPTGPAVGATYGLVVTLRDGLIQRLDIHEDGQEALRVSRGE